MEEEEEAGAPQCQLCFGELASESVAVAVLTTGREYAFHSRCLEKVTANAPSLSSIKPSRLGIYDADGGAKLDRVRRPEESAANHKRCCIADCAVVDDHDFEFVVLSCTNALCVGTAAHASCLARREEQMFCALRQQRANTMNALELEKAMYRSKYDIVRPLCRCASCGKGHFYREISARERGVGKRGAPRRPAAATNVPPTTARRVAAESAPRAPDAGSPPRKEDEKVDDHTSPPMDLAGCPPVDPSICPIRRSPMRDPVRCSDGHRYERCALEVWMLRHGPRSPISALPLSRPYFIS